MALTRPERQRRTLDLQLLSSPLTPVERRIAEVLMRDYPQAALLRADEVARAASTSPASVGRLAVKLGYANYRDMQAALAVEMRRRVVSPRQRLETAALGRRRRPQEVLQETVNVSIGNAQSVLEFVDGKQVEELVAALSRPDRHKVFVAGSNKAGLVAAYFALQLAQIRSGVCLLELSERLPNQLLEVSEGDLLVVFEPRRLTKAMRGLIVEAQASGARLVAFSDESPPPPLAGATVLFRTRIESTSIFDSYIGLFVLCDSVLSLLVHRLGEPVRRRVDRLEALNLDFEVWA